jgi:uncharacterized NAD(P)/FAD-binding protein YdhS
MLLARSLQQNAGEDFRITLITKERERTAGRMMAAPVGPAIEILEGECASLAETAAGIAITLSDGAVYSGDIAILATGCDSFGLDEGCVASPRLLGPDAVGNTSVLILGTGPLAVDYVLRLIEGRHSGPIYLLSNHGRVPFADEAASVYEVDLADIPIGTSLAYLLRWMRSLALWCGERGYDWRGVVDGLKPHAGIIWRHLSMANRKRFLAHARAWWDAHAYRIAPSATRSIQQALRSGQLTVFAGRLTSIDKAGDGMKVTFRPRGQSRTQRLAATYVVNCEDIPQDLASSPSPVIRSLIDNGFARPDPLMLGLDVSHDCEVIGADGTPSRRLYAIGPPTRGAFYDAQELAGISAQSEVVIRKLLGGSAVHNRAA